MAFAGIVLVVNAVLIAFVLPFYIAMIVTIGSGVLMFALPTVNYIRTWFAIRQHNNQVVNAVSSQQISALVQREKKAAVDIFALSPSRSLPS